MKRIELLNSISGMFEFKSIHDASNNEFVLFKENTLDSVDEGLDKTSFESSQNHKHLIDNIKKDEFLALIPIANSFGNALLCNLKYYYPKKHFLVFVSIRLYDSMIIRFHQKWENEESFCNPDEFTSPNEKVFMFEA